MNNNDCVLRVEDIHKSFGGKEVLRGITFDVRRGETKVFIGPSGTGKSTLLRCINQLTLPDRGRVWLDGEALRRLVEGVARPLVDDQPFGLVGAPVDLLRRPGRYDRVGIPVDQEDRRPARKAGDRSGPGVLGREGDDDPDQGVACRRLDHHRSPEGVPDEPDGPDAPALQVAHTDGGIDDRLHEVGRVPVLHPECADPVVLEAFCQARVEPPPRGVKPAADTTHHDDAGACPLRLVVAAGGRPPVGLDLHDIVGLAGLGDPPYIRGANLNPRSIHINRSRPEHGGEWIRCYLSFVAAASMRSNRCRSRAGFCMGKPRAGMAGRNPGSRRRRDRQGRRDVRGPEGVRDKGEGSASSPQAASPNSDVLHGPVHGEIPEKSRARLLP